MIRRAWPLLLVAALALPARGELVTSATTQPGRTPALSQRAIEALTPVDTTPDMIALDQLFGPNAAQSLMATAADPNADAGLAIRAVRALPAYCANQLDPTVSAACATNTEPHDTIVGVVRMYQNDHTPQGLMKLRASIEALGLTRSSDPNDVELLLPLTEHDSRDIRAASATALGNLCNTSAQAWLQQREVDDQSLQVRAALTVAIRKLQNCGPEGM